MGVGTSIGFFNSTLPMLDTKQVFNPKGSLQPTSSINITARYHSTSHHVLASAIFKENARVLTGEKSRSPTGEVLGYTNRPPGPYGNDTSSAGSNLVQPVMVEVNGTLSIGGNYMMVNSPVTFWVSSTQVGSSITNGTGYFNSTISIPLLPAGTFPVKVINDGVVYEFNIQMFPTMIAEPGSGPVGTVVTLKAFGFPSNTKWFVYWDEITFGDATWYQEAHGTVGPSGTFNVTVAFRVPNAYGGNHLIAVASGNVTKGYDLPGTVEAYATAVVTASTTTTTTTSTTTSTTTTTTTTSTTSTSTTSTSTSTSSTTQTTSTSTSSTTSTSTVSTTSTTSTKSTTQTSTTATTTTASTTTPPPSSPSTFVYLALVVVAVVLVVGVVWVLRTRKS
jgi:hypothetical protein